jgi:transcriptional regulator with XRE-family HTH domain
MTTSNAHPGLRAASLRKTLGLTQEEVAARSGLARSSVAEFETGSCDFGPRRARKLAGVLGCSARELVDPVWLLDE